jgi:hypothetical protein
MTDEIEIGPIDIAKLLYCLERNTVACETLIRKVETEFGIGKTEATNVLNYLVSADYLEREGVAPRTEMVEEPTCLAFYLTKKGEGLIQKYL